MIFNPKSLYWTVKVFIGQSKCLFDGEIITANQIIGYIHAWIELKDKIKMDYICPYFSMHLKNDLIYSFICMHYLYLFHLNNITI